MSLLERLFFFHQETLNNRYPNSRSIVEQFEVSMPTAKRDITYLRDRLLAPLAFDARKNGFFYQQDGFHLPFEESPRIVFLLAMLGKLAEEAGLKELKEVQELEQRLSTLISSDYRKVLEALQVQWIEVESINSKVFEGVIEAVVKRRQLQFCYSPVQGEPILRTVAPLQIICYQGRWYLLGHCMLRQADRLFLLARIGEPQLLRQQIAPHITFNQQSLAQSFGIFQGSPLYDAEILFTSTAAELVRKQTWHQNQQLKSCEEGILLTLPVSDHRELMMKILQYGSMARVVSPPELVERVREEIGRMNSNYP